MKSIVIKFGLLSFALLVLFQLSKYSLFYQSFKRELLIVLFGLLFLTFGFLASRLLVRSGNKMEEPVREVDEKKIDQLGISKREYEVLVEIAQGLSNQEIAEKLFISESTVKTHVSNLLAKLNAKRRPQAVTIAKKMRLLL